MATFFAAFILMLSFGGILFWLFRLSAPGRRGELYAAASALDFNYEPWHPLEQNIRRAGFRLLSCGENRYVPHFIEGDDVVLFDFTTSTHSVTTQTLVVMPCPLARDVRLMIGPQVLPPPDCFSEQTTLLRVGDEDLPVALKGLKICACAAHKVHPILSGSVSDWILSHPHLHIECAGGMLLACQPGYLIRADEIARVINDVRDLRKRLTP